jgi:hypothetical protein
MWDKNGFQGTWKSIGTTTKQGANVSANSARKNEGNFCSEMKQTRQIRQIAFSAGHLNLIYLK